MSQHAHAHPEQYATGDRVIPAVRDLDDIRDAAKYAPPDEPDDLGINEDCGHTGTRFACDTCQACGEYEDYLMDGADR